MKNFEVATLILNWNQAIETIRCVNKLLSNVDFKQVILIVDNGSGDDSFSVIEAAFAHYEREVDFDIPAVLKIDASVSFVVSEKCLIRIVRASENSGFAGGMNRAISIGKEYGVKYFFLLNNDAEILSSDILKLSKFSEQNQDAVVGPLVMDYDESDEVSFEGKKWPQILFGINSSPKVVGADYWQTGYVEGSAMLLPRRFIEGITASRGYVFDERFFLYCEDVDLCLMAKKLGFPCAVYSKVRAFHKGSKSSGGTGSALAYYYITRNRILLAQKWLTRFQFLLFCVYYMSSRTAFSFARLFSASGRSTNRAVWRGLQDGFNWKFGKRES